MSSNLVKISERMPACQHAEILHGSIFLEDQDRQRSENNGAGVEKFLIPSVLLFAVPIYLTRGPRLLNVIDLARVEGPPVLTRRRLDLSDEGGEKLDYGCQLPRDLPSVFL